MGNINKDGIAQAKKLRKKNLAELIAFTSGEFNLDDKEQQLKFKKYIDEFELAVNKMYIFQYMEKGLIPGLAFIIPSWLLPIPNFVNYLFTSLLYFGVAGALAKHFRMTDFLEKQQEIETIYNWCLKNKQSLYIDSIDNSKKLESPQIQRLIKLLAPLCDPKFMIAWPTTRGTWSRTINAGYSALSATFSMFSQAQTLEQQRLEDLKTKVEKEELSLNTYTGFEQAIRYFANSPDFKGLIVSQIQAPLAMVEQFVPASVIESFRPKSA